MHALDIILLSILYLHWHSTIIYHASIANSEPGQPHSFSKMLSAKWLIKVTYLKCLFTKYRIRSSL